MCQSPSPWLHLFKFQCEIMEKIHAISSPGTSEYQGLHLLFLNVQFVMILSYCFCPFLYETIIK